jgi:hypothetical protein
MAHATRHEQQGEIALMHGVEAEQLAKRERCSVRQVLPPAPRLKPLTAFGAFSKPSAYRYENMLKPRKLAKRTPHKGKNGIVGTLAPSFRFHCDHARRA